MHTYTLYTYDYQFNEVGSTEAASEAEAVKVIFALYYKREVADDEFEIEKLEEGTYQIITKTNDFLLKRK